MALLLKRKNIHRRLQPKLAIVIQVPTYGRQGEKMKKKPAKKDDNLYIMQDLSAKELRQLRKMISGR